MSRSFRVSILVLQKATVTERPPAYTNLGTLYFGFICSHDANRATGIS